MQVTVIVETESRVAQGRFERPILCLYLSGLGLQGSHLVWFYVALLVP